MSSVAAVAAGAYHSLALKSDGTVVAWGYNAYGQCDVPAGLDLTLIFKLPGRRYVSSDGNCANHFPCHSTIHSALGAAEHGDLIYVEQGTYPEAPTWNTPRAVSINGGWNPGFTDQTGTTDMYAPVAAGGATVKLLPKIRVVAQP